MNHILSAGESVWLGLRKIVMIFPMVILFFSPSTTKALMVDLDAYVDLAILQEDLTTPLADGSWVFIIGSGDNIIDPMEMYGGTNFIADSVTGDDVILARIQIPLNAVTNSGTFFTTVQYESDDINYAYIRFFDTTNNPIVGLQWWGTSSVFQLGVTLGVATVQFDQGGQLAATNQNNFVVIPEPGTMNLFIVVAGMMCAMRVRMKASQKFRDAHEA